MLPLRLATQPPQSYFRNSCLAIASRCTSSGPSASRSVRALAVTSATRIPVLKDVPTVGELGLPKAEAYNWYGMLAPANTPAEVINKMYVAVGAALKSPDLKQQFEQQGVEVVGSKPEEFAPFIAAESERWGALAKAVGAKLD